MILFARPQLHAPRRAGVSYHSGLVGSFLLARNRSPIVLVLVLVLVLELISPPLPIQGWCVGLEPPQKSFRYV